METPLTLPALRALRRILRASDRANRQLAAATGLTPSQLLLLKEIGEGEGTTPTQLADALHFSQATITNICDRLHALGLVARTRGEQDKRRVHLTATSAGKDMIDRAPDLLQARFSERFGELSRWEQAMILTGLERLGDVLGFAEDDAAPLFDSGAIDRLHGSPG